MPMIDLTTHALGIAAALGIGLLIGVDREKSKIRESQTEPAGIRTFALAALLGAILQIAGGNPGLLLAVGVIAVYAATAYWRTGETYPGITTEVALVLTTALGGLAQINVVVAAAVGVVVALLLVSRTWLHALVRVKLDEQEVFDAVLLAAAAIVVLPLLPDRAVDPYGVLNPRVIWTLAVFVMLINAAGYVALRAFGAAKGLAIAGLVGGFVSSIATIASMGSRAREGAGGAVAGATLSSVPTVIQLAIIIGITNYPLLRPLWPALAAATLVAVIYGAAFSVRALRSEDGSKARRGRAFQPRTAIIFAVTVTAVLFFSAALAHYFGATGGMLGIAVAGFADAHASAASAASLARSQEFGVNAALVAILLAFTTNTISKAVVAWTSGGTRFALAVIPGLLLMLVAAWVGALAAGIRPLL
jgi:uncharacterized membrane protein (DUF4010 family)